MTINEQLRIQNQRCLERCERRLVRRQTLGLLADILICLLICAYFILRLNWDLKSENEVANLVAGILSIPWADPNLNYKVKLSKYYEHIEDLKAMLDHVQ